MSNHGFHVHGPHDHELEYAAHDGGRDRFAGTIAVMTAILATVGALCSYMGGAAQANAGLLKNNAAIKLDSERLEAQAKSWDEQSDAQTHLHHRWAQSTTALQVSIALAAMALLTRQKWLEWGMYGVASVGVALGGLALAHM